MGVLSRGPKRRKIGKLRGVSPLLCFCGGFVVIIRRGAPLSEKGDQEYLIVKVNYDGKCERVCFWRFLKSGQKSQILDL